MHIQRILASVAIAAAACAAQAQQSEVIIGKTTFDRSCAVCHGFDAEAQGNISELFKTPPRDLTTIAQRNDGVFPLERVYHVIAGDIDERAHGDSEMPVWGDYFMADALEDRGINAKDASDIAQGRILSVVYYLLSIQK
ncbi:c-type cytochrome [Primorskyibacter aestuariivivens]|uniref:c-type cytochrome n=1 Tax=Primorskyibacter aestuariivivens TaxID=1888912 RepID=UPI002301B175|nr:c-type cytochrome [Primorskyibacter aestuariivivens]MDA7430006.1 c-type cytochrome [Primorskyibacter aestuariivivens]